MTTCCSCFKPKANYQCELCESSICKACTQFKNEDSFAFYKVVPEKLNKNVYCPQCFDQNVAEPLDEYNALVEKAKTVAVFFKEESKKTRLFSRKEEPVEVLECLDEDETVLRLAFLAAQKKFNSIIDVDLKYLKIKNGSHLYHVWNGKAVPCNLDEKTLNREFYD